MANDINLVKKMLPLLGEIYKSGAKSSGLEAPAEFVQESMQANEVKLAKLDLVGLGDYDKATGFPTGDITLEWETHTFNNDRGRRFSIDRMDDMESFELVAGRMVGEFMRTQVIPEVDAYRFSKIASATGVETATAATLTASSCKSALDAAIINLQEKEVDDSRMIIYMTPTVAQFLSDNITRSVANGDKNVNNIIETYNGIEIVRVPQTRFYKGITLNDGSSASAGGYSKTATTGADINFIVMDRGAVYNVTKQVVSKYITPDQNQSKDAHQFDFRLYYETFILENKAEGIYVHTKAAG